jgi:hypothetical protein
MAMEREQVWTQNSHYMVSSKQCFQDMLTKQLYGSGAAAKALSETTPNFSGVVGKDSLEQGLSLLASVGIKLSPEDLEMAVARKKQKTCQEDEGLLELIASTLAYFKVGGVIGTQADLAAAQLTEKCLTDIECLALSCSILSVCPAVVLCCSTCSLARGS